MYSVNINYKLFPFQKPV